MNIQWPSLSCRQLDLHEESGQLNDRENDVNLSQVEPLNLLHIVSFHLYDNQIQKHKWRSLST